MSGSLLLSAAGLAHQPFLELFFRRHGEDIVGRVIEASGDMATDRDGKPRNLPDDSHDCIVLVQPAEHVADVDLALRTAHRILKPGGTLLMVVPGAATVPTGSDASARPLDEGLFRVLLAKYFDHRKLLIESHAIAHAGGSMALTARAAKPPPPFNGSAGDPPAKGNVPAVSIITPIYNAERTVGDTIESLLRQTVTDWELIVVDDGSSDRSVDVVTAYATRFPARVFLDSHPDGRNHGASHTRNRGLARARGEFVCFLDADDTWHPRKLAHDLSVLARHPEAAAVFGATMYWWDDDSGRQAHVDRIAGPADVVRAPPGFCLDTFVHKLGDPPCIHALMLRRSALAAVGTFDTNLPTYEDQKLIASLGFAFPVYLSSRCLSEYRRHDATLWPTADRLGIGAIAQKRFSEWLGTLTSGRSPAPVRDPS